MRIPGRSVWLAALALSVGLACPAAAGAAKFDSNDVFSVPTRDIDTQKLSKHKARITLDGVTEHGTLISTDGKEKPEVLSLRRFERDFSKLGLGRHPEMRVTTRGPGGKHKSVDFKLRQPRYDRVHDRLVVVATTPSGYWRAPKLAGASTNASPGVNFSGNFGSQDGPITITYWLDEDAQFSTVVTGSGLKTATVSLMVDGTVVYMTTLFAADAIANFGPMTLDAPTVLGPGQLTLNVPTAGSIGSVSVQTSIGSGAGLTPFNAVIASWSAEVL